MEVVNFGHFTASTTSGIVYYQNGDGQDWYDLRASLTRWTDTGAFVDSVYGAWAAVNPSTMRVTNVEFDPSRLIPDNKIILGIDADPADITIGMLFTGTSMLDVPMPAAIDDVDLERDRRIDGGFMFNGVLYQSRPQDRENIAGASTAALAAIVNGAQPGDYRWHGGNKDFAWISADNSTHLMDAQTMFAFGQAAMAHKQSLIFAGRAIKNIVPVPNDFATNSAFWP